MVRDYISSNNTFEEQNNSFCTLKQHPGQIAAALSMISESCGYTSRSIHDRHDCSFKHFQSILQPVQTDNTSQDVSVDKDCSALIHEHSFKISSGLVLSFHPGKCDRSSSVDARD